MNKFSPQHTLSLCLTLIACTWWITETITDANDKKIEHEYIMLKKMSTSPPDIEISVPSQEPIVDYLYERPDMPVPPPSYQRRKLD